MSRLTLLGTRIGLLILLVWASVFTDGIIWNPPWHDSPRAGILIAAIAVLGAVLGSLATVIGPSTGRRRLAMLQCVTDIVTADVLITMIHEIAHVDIWPIATLVLFAVGNRYQLRGALLAWAAVLPGVFAGFALQHHPGSAVLVALLLLACAVNTGTLAAVVSTKTAALHRQARTDPLTGLLNRAALDDWVARHAPAATGLTVIVLDLDGFKGINDRLGHHAGDVVLQTVADRLRDCLDTDARTPEHQRPLLARTGGDEFVIVLPSEAPRDTAEVVARLAAAGDEDILIDGAPAPFGISIGTASGPDGFATLLKAADAQMYRDKARRRTAA